MKKDKHVRQHETGLWLPGFLVVFVLFAILFIIPVFAMPAARPFHPGERRPAAASPSVASLPAASPSGASSPDASQPVASPSQTPQKISYIDVPDLIVLETGQATDSTWKSVLPQRAEAFVNSGSNPTVWCELSWSVTHVRWEEPGLYHAEAKILPPKGYYIGKYVDSDFESVISIHPPGTSQFLDVFASYGHFAQAGHTWTFAMKLGQDITPLVETLEKVTRFSGILDAPKESIYLTATWDFSAVDTSKPGIYPIYRSLKIDESSLPVGLSPDTIYLSEYWSRLPVLLSVEDWDGPQLYGVLENPTDFFGSYALLTEQQLADLEVWYSVNGGDWILQTDEGLMETELKRYTIHKSGMETGIPYSFRLKLGDHTSRTLTVTKKPVTPIWFLWNLGGNRDGTIDVDFPTISQPPPSETPEETPSETLPEPPFQTPDEPDSEDDSYSTFENPGPSESTVPTVPELPSAPAETPASAVVSSGTLAAGPSKGTSDASLTESPAAAVPTETAPVLGPGQDPDPHPSADNSPHSSELDATLPPEEIVTRWSSQLSGKRIHKLLELYPDWIRFQKENICILLSSDWLRKQQLKDSDILTVEVSPKKEHAVTILVNQKAPADPPVYQVEILSRDDNYFPGSSVVFMAALIILFITILKIKGRWRK